MDTEEATAIAVRAAEIEWGAMWPTFSREMQAGITAAIAGHILALEKAGFTLLANKRNGI